MYDGLSAGIAANLKAGSVRVVEYPSRIVTNGRDQHDSCGVLTGLSDGEARWISRRGDELNAALAEGAERNGWGYVSGIRDAFRHHGYCAGKTWFRSFSASKKLQGNKRGTAHPLWAGHAAAGEIVAPHIPSEEKTLSKARVRVTFERLRLYSPRPYEQAGDLTLASPTFGVAWHDLHRVPVSARQAARGTWITIPPEDRTTMVATFGDTIALHGGVQVPGAAADDVTGSEDPRAEPSDTDGSHTLGLSSIHRRGDGWRPGLHTIGGEHAGSAYQLQYRVSVLGSRPLAPDVGPATTG